VTAGGRLGRGARDDAHARARSSRAATPAALALVTLLAGCGGAQARSAPHPPSHSRAPAAVPRPPAASPPCGLTVERLAVLGAPVRMASVTTVYPHSPPGRNQNLAAAARYLCGRVLAPGERLSFNAAIGLTTKDRGYTYGPTFVGDRVIPGMGGGVCQVATTLYDAARRAGIAVVERHQHGMRVPYVPPGEDATVAHPWLDLVIRNSTGGTMVIAAEAVRNRVRVELYGSEPPPRTGFRHRILSTTPFPTIRIADPTLPAGREITLQEGVDGVVAHTWYVIQRPGQAERVVDLGVDSYRPSPHIVRFGTARAMAPAPAPTPAAD
jgi:vancomycin resistance protein VanW